MLHDTLADDLHCSAVSKGCSSGRDAVVIVKGLAHWVIETPVLIKLV